MSYRNVGCTGCGHETYHKSGRCMRCRNYGTAKPLVSSVGSNSVDYSSPGRRRGDMDCFQDMNLEQAIGRLSETIRAHEQNKRNKFAAADRRAIEVVLKELKK